MNHTLHSLLVSYHTIRQISTLLTYTKLQNCETTKLRNCKIWISKCITDGSIRCDQSEMMCLRQETNWVYPSPAMPDRRSTDVSMIHRNGLTKPRLSDFTKNVFSDRLFALHSIPQIPHHARQCSHSKSVPLITQLQRAITHSTACNSHNSTARSHQVMWRTKALIIVQRLKNVW